MGRSKVFFRWYLPKTGVLRGSGTCVLKIGPVRVVLCAIRRTPERVSGETIVRFRDGHTIRNGRTVINAIRIAVERREK